MRYVTVRLEPDGAAFGAAEQKIAVTDAITRQSIHHINVLADQTVVMLEEFRGDIGQLRRVFDSQPEVLAFDVTESRECIFLYVHFEANETVGDLLRLPQQHEVILDTPMEYTADGDLRVTVVGEQSEIQQLMETIPEQVHVEVEQIGRYEPEHGRLFAQLTEQQQETLQLAVERGYFEVPRKTTCEELAAELGVSTSAVSTQLRRIQAVVLTSVTP